MLLPESTQAPASALVTERMFEPLSMSAPFSSLLAVLLPPRLNVLLAVDVLLIGPVQINAPDPPLFLREALPPVKISKVRSVESPLPL